MKPIYLDTTNAQQAIVPELLDSTKADVAKGLAVLRSRSGKGNDFLGWIDLPESVDKTLIKRIKDDVSRLRPKIKVFVVIGIGGSYLGARAVIEAIRSELEECGGESGVKIIYAGHTLNEDYYCQLTKVLDRNDYAVAVISKSGTTTEPAIAFRIIKNHLETKYGKAEASQRIIAITDASKGALHSISESEGYSSYVIPDNVGGRFSVLTPVGLLPIAMAGLDIEKLIEGAKEMRTICTKSDKMEENPAVKYAVYRNAIYRMGRKVEIMENYAPQLRYLSEWWKQLYGESEGKEGKGILPHSLSFTTDLHSMGQYVQEGERSMFETVISVTESNEHIDIPSDEQNLDGLNYLMGKTLTEINHCAEKGTIIAHINGNVPVIRIEVPRIDEYYLGQLIYFFEYACGISGYTLGVNPFDQPGVEAYKKNMFRLLGKPGYAR